MKNLLLSLFIAVITAACKGYTQEGMPQKFEIEKSDEAWKKALTPEQFQITRKKGTEKAFSGKYVYNHQIGTYHCVCCKQEIFTSNTKFEAGTGWPSFWSPISNTNVLVVSDDSKGVSHEEVICSKCGAHLGYLFDDGPKPTGKRYSINSLSLAFEKK
ncbi:peptide-methionine (R)-S-oxide reductase MsrB [Arcicella aquatica]|uniref:peptide-methionine (R)-S-oxide reductase n=1 Tax=Arcicella aquatica TaxID=217141 RepID=A0ABU5QQD6_9BACT|nr:peptide-methionine (R)-S-oxide reductase MsrB [Arcicella aquatica]MEA5259085.1 peptide-methionine (R)-S-oxide reductase MsrB [Arcicella aquatica]